MYEDLSWDIQNPWKKPCRYSSHQNSRGKDKQILGLTSWDGSSDFSDRCGSVNKERMTKEDI